MVKNISVRVSPLAHPSKKPYQKSILPTSPPTEQSQNYKRLAQTIHGGQLLTSFEILHENGIRDKLTISMLFNLHFLEVAV